jgi:hypothetical protein
MDDMESKLSSSDSWLSGNFSIPAEEQTSPDHRVTNFQAESPQPSTAEQLARRSGGNQRTRSQFFFALSINSGLGRIVRRSGIVV